MNLFTYLLIYLLVLCSSLLLTASMSRRDADLDRHSDDAVASRPLEAATEAAQRINALLIAKGILKPSQVSSVPHKAKQQVCCIVALSSAPALVCGNIGFCLEVPGIYYTR